MSNGAALASLITLFRDGTASKKVDDRLVDLFRSRIQLKKDLAALRNENYHLQDALKRQAGSVAHVERRLSRIEALLRDPESSHNVVTFYQLRAVGDECHERLKSRAEQLRREREDAFQSTMLAAWRRRREDKAFAVKRKISECRTSKDNLEVRLNALRNDLDDMGILRRFFRRRFVATEIEAILASSDEKRRQEGALLEELQRIEANSPPEKEGLDVASKRMVNFQILAFAQQLYLQYDEAGLAQMLRDARAMDVGGISYGDKETCDAILRRLLACDSELRASEKQESALAKRTRLIADAAEYHEKDDAVPIPGSVSTLYDFDEDGRMLQQEVDLLGENYFGLGVVLIR